ncbi:hypothetical protein MHN80_01010 [Gordonia McavH-238-E]|uniref:hypothetical protein n=1 Tax=Gordonia sp. McavH-238-E TaxID=2917736 RepID=UPI001EF3E9E8|nr:hypothetical protein [Gordonia sp. McavH-238-E]MCG7630883.1 hypothetical protein [Gordonia sp. McavH-238-E]
MNVTAVDNMDDVGYPTLVNWEASFGWSTADGRGIAGVRVHSTTHPEHVAELILNQLTNKGVGFDPAYTSWYQRMLERVNQHQALPIAYAEHLDPRQGWEVGPSIGVRISPPPGNPRTLADLVTPSAGWYVYALRDASTGRVLFVGEGHGDRVFTHAVHLQREWERSDVGPTQHTHVAASTQETSIHGFIIRSGLESASVASGIAAAITTMLALVDPALHNQFFTLSDFNVASNASGGGLASVDLDSASSVITNAQAPPITVPALLIKIPRLWKPTMDAIELYDATRQWWRLGERRQNARYAFAVAQGIIREVYRIDSWEPGWVVNGAWTTEPQNRPPDRWRFQGDVAESLAADYKNTKVKHLYKAGEANPVRYLNC